MAEFKNEFLWSYTIAIDISQLITLAIATHTFHAFKIKVKVTQLRQYLTQADPNIPIFTKSNVANMYFFLFLRSHICTVISHDLDLHYRSVHALTSDASGTRKTPPAPGSYRENISLVPGVISA